MAACDTSQLTVTWGGCAAVFLRGALVDKNTSEGPVPEHIALAVESALSPLQVSGVPAIINVPGQVGKDSVRQLYVGILRSGDAENLIAELSDVCRRGFLMVNESTNGGITTLTISEAPPDED